MIQNWKTWIKEEFIGVYRLTLIKIRRILKFWCFTTCPCSNKDMSQKLENLKQWISEITSCKENGDKVNLKIAFWFHRMDFIFNQKKIFHLFSKVKTRWRISLKSASNDHILREVLPSISPNWYYDVDITHTTPDLSAFLMKAK